MTQDKILDKLSKMKAAAAGEAALGNTAAAEAFAQAVNRLLIQHELSEQDIPVGGVAKDDPIVEQVVDPRKHGVKFSRSRVGWQETLAGIVAEAHLCRILVTPGANWVTLVGTRAHVEVAEYAYGTLLRAADTMSKEARDAYWRVHRDDPDFESGNYRAAWISGFIWRIAERLREARRAEVRASGLSESTALVRLDQALVKAKTYVDEKYKTKASAVRVQSGISRGREDGRRAADGVALGRKGVRDGVGKKELS